MPLCFNDDIRARSGRVAEGGPFVVLILAIVVLAGTAGAVWSWSRRTPAGPAGPVGREHTARLSRPVLLVAALAGQAALGSLPVGLRGALAAVDCLLVVAWAVANRRSRSGLPGLPLVGAGCALNSVVIALNGGMPVSRWALGMAGLPPTMDVSRGHLDKHVTMTSSTLARGLGDVLPVRLLHTVVSAGDVVMAVGIAAAVFGATTTLWAGRRPGRIGRRELGGAS